MQNDTQGSAEELLSKAWKEDPEIIRKYTEDQESYVQLCQEVEYILGRAVDERGIKIASLTSRVKTLKSFIEKINRKSYSDPFKETTDFAGVRLAFLYKDDLGEIFDIINKNFQIVGTTDKTQKDVDQFGYSAIHYNIKLRKSRSGARYEDLKDFVCEVQVRTVLQDAWAIIEHHLAYKQDTGLGDLFKRKLNRIVAILEDADERFIEIRNEREIYAELVQLRANANWPQFLREPLNAYTLITYLENKFPECPPVSHSTEKDKYKIAANVISAFKEMGYEKVEHLEKHLSKLNHPVQAFVPAAKDSTAIGIMLILLSLMNNKVRFYIDRSPEVTKQRAATFKEINEAK